MRTKPLTNETSHYFNFNPDQARVSAQTAMIINTVCTKVK